MSVSEVSVKSSRGRLDAHYFELTSYSFYAIYSQTEVYNLCAVIMKLVLFVDHLVSSWVYREPLEAVVIVIFVMLSVNKIKIQNVYMLKLYRSEIHKNIKKTNSTSQNGRRQQQELPAAALWKRESRCEWAASKRGMVHDAGKSFVLHALDDERVALPLFKIWKIRKAQIGAVVRRGEHDVQLGGVI